MDNKKGTTVPRNGMPCSRSTHTPIAYRKIQCQFHFVLLIVVCGILIHSCHFPKRPELFESIIAINYESRQIFETSKSDDTETTSRIDVHTEQPMAPTTATSPLVYDAPVSLDNKSKVSTLDKQKQESKVIMNKSSRKDASQEEAIAAYRALVQNTNTSALRCIQQRKQQTSMTISVKPALQCLRMTKGNIGLQYPIDAEQHYNEIRYLLAPFAQHQNHTFHSATGFSGPWIENQFITHFETLYDSQHETSCIHQHFGPYIPIFLPWVDHLIQNKYYYPDGMVETLLSVLRPNVPYITVSQNARGLKGKAGISIRKSIPNLLVLSAGGHGHVPIPLLKQDEVQNNYIDVPNRTIDISYVGSLGNAPNNVRKIMNEQLMEKYSKNQTTNNNNRLIRYEYYYGNDWRQYMAQSKLSLVPRGFGRTAYHLVETIQMGLVPVYIYLKNDIPWIPYETVYRKHIGYVTDFASVLPFLENTIQQLTDDEIQTKEQMIVSLLQSHFTIDGILQQIQRFMLTPTKSDLQCQPLPRYITGIPKYGT
jgi:hypothetical protein